MVVQYLKKYNIAYAKLPFTRDQDIIKVTAGRGNLQYIASVVDGWNNETYIKGNEAGRKAAKYVLQNYPKTFLSLTIKNIHKRAEKATVRVDNELLALLPKHAACVAVFLFSYRQKDIIVAVGTINTFLWQRKHWFKPKEIGDYFLPVPPYASGSRTFFGRGELKNDKLYSAKPDVVVCSPQTPLIIATDGLDDVMSLDALNQFTENLSDWQPKWYIMELMKNIKKRKTQKDDIAVLVRFPSRE